MPDTDQLRERWDDQLAKYLAGSITEDELFSWVAARSHNELLGELEKLPRVGIISTSTGIREDYIHPTDLSLFIARHRRSDH